MILRTSKLEAGQTIVEKDGKFILTNTFNIDEVAQANYEAKKDSQDGWAKDRSYRRYGRVPMPVLMMWKQEFPEIMSGDREAEHKALKILFDRPENEIFMVVEKKAGRTI